MTTTLSSSTSSWSNGNHGNELLTEGGMFPIGQGQGFGPGIVGQTRPLHGNNTHSNTTMTRQQPPPQGLTSSLYPHQHTLSMAATHSSLSSSSLLGLDFFDHPQVFVHHVL